MRSLERVRLREGITKPELARRLKTHKAVIRSWLTGESIGRKASVERIKAFLEDRSKRSDRACNTGADQD